MENEWQRINFQFHSLCAQQMSFACRNMYKPEQIRNKKGRITVSLTGFIREWIKENGIDKIYCAGVKENVSSSSWMLFKVIYYNRAILES